jgi:hypothetical protein
MPTNVYFDTGTKPERSLYEDLIIEQLKIYGQDVYYIPRKMAGTNNVFLEDVSSSFETSYVIEMYLETNDGYEGEKELMSKFGLDIQDDAKFVVARRRWEQFVAIDNNLVTNTRPNEGDLIYWSRGKKLFEITFVDHDDPFYQVNELPAYKLVCKTFEYGSEKIDTGVLELDNIDKDNSLDQLDKISLEAETIRLSPSTTGTGSIIMENDVEDAPPTYIVQEVANMGTIDENSQNDIFETLDDNILDFTEGNPFGDAGMR